MKNKDLDTIKLSTLEKAIKKIKKEIAPNKDCDISFEFIIGSFFPKILENIKDTFTTNYMEGYKAGKEEAKNESQRNN
jgi:hypothetical protein